LLLTTSWSPASAKPYVCLSLVDWISEEEEEKKKKRERERDYNALASQQV